MEKIEKSYWTVFEKISFKISPIWPHVNFLTPIKPIYSYFLAHTSLQLMKTTLRKMYAKIEKFKILQNEKTPSSYIHPRNIPTDFEKKSEHRLPSYRCWQQS